MQGNGPFEDCCGAASGWIRGAGSQACQAQRQQPATSPGHPACPADTVPGGQHQAFIPNQGRLYKRFTSSVSCRRCGLDCLLMIKPSCKACAVHCRQRKRRTPVQQIRERFSWPVRLIACWLSPWLRVACPPSPCAARCCSRPRQPTCCIYIAQSCFESQAAGFVHSFHKSMIREALCSVSAAMTSFQDGKTGCAMSHEKQVHFFSQAC